MNIPDEVGEQALKADDTWAFIAVWARKEALREAADVLNSDLNLYGRIEDIHLSGEDGSADSIQDEFVSAIRALAERDD